mgnify:CR=1 FL=1
MKLHIEGTPEEFADKSETLTKAFIDSLREHSPELAESLEKALPKPQVKLRNKMMQELHERTRTEYRRVCERIVKDVGKVLEKGAPAMVRTPVKPGERT